MKKNKIYHDFQFIKRKVLPLTLSNLKSRVQRTYSNYIIKLRRVNYKGFNYLKGPQNLFELERASNYEGSN